MFYDRDGERVFLEKDVNGSENWPFKADPFVYTKHGKLFEKGWFCETSTEDVKSFRGRITRGKLRQILNLLGFGISYPASVGAFKVEIRIPRKHFVKFWEIINS